MSLQTICAVCEEGVLETRKTTRQVDGQGLSLMVEGLRHQVCPICGVEQFGPDELRHNKQLVMAARKRAKGLLTGAQVREIRSSLGLTQAQAAEVFGGGRNAFSKYENDVVEQSDAMDKLLRVAHIPGVVASPLRIIILPSEGVAGTSNLKAFIATASSNSNVTVTCRAKTENKYYGTAHAK